MRITLGFSFLIWVTACGGGEDGNPGPTPPFPPPPEPPPQLTIELVTGGLDFPLGLVSPPGDPRLFVVEKDGRIRIVRNGTLLSTLFLDHRASVSTAGERGLLGLAFHPEFATNGLFVLDYTDPTGRTVLSTMRVSVADPDRADPATEVVGLTVNQPFSNHNGGDLAFGPDGFLYAGLGDGGGAGDPENNGQRAETLLGALLRLAVDPSTGTMQPAPGNPFAGQAGGRPEIWAIGLRNPWRFSFDRGTGDLYIADVGQNRREEINVARAADGGGRGANYGWNVMEGTLCFSPSTNCNRAGLVEPVLEYDHSRGCSVTGGHVYRGSALPEEVGVYFYGDFCTGQVRSFRLQGSGGGAVEIRDRSDLDVPGNLTSFGLDAAGELHLLVVSGGSGQLFRMVRAP